MITVGLRSTQSKRSSGHFANGPLRFEHLDTPTSRTAHFVNAHFANAHFANRPLREQTLLERTLRERTLCEQTTSRTETLRRDRIPLFLFLQKSVKKFFTSKLLNTHSKMFLMTPGFQNIFFTIFRWLCTLQNGSCISYGGHSKVTSLQALLRKASRSPGDVFLGDFGIFCLFFFLGFAQEKNKPKIPHLFA